MTATITPTCARGHELVGDNAIPRGAGGFRCRTCKRETSRNRTARLRAKTNAANTMTPARGDAQVDLSWTERAMCSDLAPLSEFDDGFFAADGERGIPERVRETARRACAHCPVRAQCGAAATTDRALGLWGGIWRQIDPDTKRYQLIPLIAGDDEEVQA
ncbi:MULTISPECIES: WhiB family transcriptional regulator [unclassified Saccharopolyspora]|uniref:WhiB family transcriptional regulator n=1 Tax=unclassified Saccharopolyspora TaxID=2646250 RepID=UPI001CD3B81A|nr:MULTISPECIES: WhiB family transcriptional regulator [unclassified Saccharopolyspora]MCA1185771.1 WhiB family transcriptional regulator [Saccharopolyspora sp. 6T]MCA1191683.1 WhiB family transcriptional regulator [Saccharopolyspora sp. 6V]